MLHNEKKLSIVDFSKAVSESNYSSIVFDLDNQDCDTLYEYKIGGSVSFDRCSVYISPNMVVLSSNRTRSAISINNVHHVVDEGCTGSYNVYNIVCITSYGHNVSYRISFIINEH